MLDDTSAVWWYGKDGQQAGPVTAAALGRLVAEGRVLPGHLVWRDGMPGWQPLSSVAELAEALASAPRATFPAPPPVPRPPPVPPGPPRFPGASPTGYGQRAAPGPGTLEEIPVAGVILLTIVTFGIYGVVKFYQTGRGYEALAGRGSQFGRNFWLWIGLGIASVFVNGAVHGLGVPFGLASIVFQVLTLTEALNLRAEAIRRAGIQPVVTSDGTHKALLIVGIILSFALVGLVVLLVQAAKWFGDWNAIVAALRGQRGAPAGAAS
jgi:hypothetical protein